jgi:hypothetical protein
METKALPKRREPISFPPATGEMSELMIGDRYDTGKKKGAIQARESRSQSLNTKLTPTELSAVQTAASAHGCALGEWVRDVILREVHGSAKNPCLPEILGVRLLLVNVLRPLAAGQNVAPEVFDKLLDEISQAKHQLAAKLTASVGGN